MSKETVFMALWTCASQNGDPSCASFIFSKIVPDIM